MRVPDHEVARGLLQLAGPMDDVIALGDIYTYLASAYQHLARFQDSMEWARQSIALGERKNYPHAVAVGYEFLAEDAYFVGLWKQALAPREGAALAVRAHVGRGLTGAQPRGPLPGRAGA